jgi:hypothetical protein
MVDETPLQGPFAFRPGFDLVAGSLLVPVAVPVPVALFVPVLFVPGPMPVVPGVTVLPGDDIPDVPPVAEPPMIPVEEELPAAPPPAPPAPPPAAKAKLLDTVNVAANKAMVIFIAFSCFGVTKNKKFDGDVFLANRRK